MLHEGNVQHAGPDALRAAIENAQLVDNREPEDNPLNPKVVNINELRGRAWDTKPGHDEWDDPLDIFADALTGTPDLPPDLLPSVIDKFARDEAARMGIEAGMTAMPALGAAAAAIDDAYRIQPKARDHRWTFMACARRRIVPEKVAGAASGD
jgi:hypothetical protein